jgi:diguanylate cyclase (GGDEF)-like protein
MRIDDLGVSRRHARITRQGTEFFVEDLESRNGTFVQDVRVTKKVLTDGVRIGLGPIVMLRFGYIDELEEGMLRRLYESAVLDALTGAHNRKHFDERLAGEVAYANRHKTELSLVLFDVDHFKQINDTFGHLAGDGVLRTIVSLVRKALRAEDVLARIGGEEFAVIARGIDGRRGRALGERVRSLVERAKFDLGGKSLQVTVSVGVASLGAMGGGEPSGSELVDWADQRLYRAKESGRNRTIGPE